MAPQGFLDHSVDPLPSPVLRTLLVDLCHCWMAETVSVEG